MYLKIAKWVLYMNETFIKNKFILQSKGMRKKVLFKFTHIFSMASFTKDQWILISVSALCLLRLFAVLPLENPTV